MMINLSLSERIFEYLLALAPHWYYVMSGVVLAFMPALEVLIPEGWKKWLDVKWSKESRHNVARWAAMIAVLLAGFFVFDESQIVIRKQQAELKATTDEKNKLTVERDTMASQLLAKKRRDAVKLQLQKFYIEGEHLENGAGVNRHSNEEEYKKFQVAVSHWRETTRNWIKDNLGDGAAARFDNTRSYYRDAINFPHAYNIHHSWEMNEIGWRRRNLELLFESDVWDRP